MFKVLNLNVNLRIFKVLLTAATLASGSAWAQEYLYAAQAKVWSPDKLSSLQTTTQVTPLRLGEVNRALFKGLEVQVVPLSHTSTHYVVKFEVIRNTEKGKQVIAFGEVESPFGQKSHVLYTHHTRELVEFTIKATSALKQAQTTPAFPLKAQEGNATPQTPKHRI